MKPPAERKIIVGLALAVWIFLMASAAIYWNTRQYVAGHESLPRMGEGLRRLKDILLALGQTESDERSYLLTGDVAFLAPARAALGKVETNLQAMESLTKGAADSRENLAGLRQLV